MYELYIIGRKRFVTALKTVHEKSDVLPKLKQAAELNSILSRIWLSFRLRFWDSL